MYIFEKFRVNSRKFRVSFAFIRESFALFRESFALIRESYAFIREKYNFFLYENEPNRLSYIRISRDTQNKLFDTYCKANKRKTPHPWYNEFLHRCIFYMYIFLI